MSRTRPGAAVQVPIRIEDITPQWLTGVLSRAGVVGKARVVAVNSEWVGHDYGAREVCRLRLTYDVAEGAVPRTLIVKIVQRDAALGMGERELRFYQELVERVPLGTPRCYYCAAANDTYAFVLEDLGGGRAGDDLQGATRPQTELVVEQLATLHAAWWEHAELKVLDWIPTRPRLEGDSWRQAMGAAWDRFAAQHAGRIPESMAQAWPLLVRHGDVIRRQSLMPPLTLCHGDFRLENMCFGLSAERPLVVFDWELLHRGQGAFDLAHFVIWGLEPELRRDLERGLLQRYCAALEANGVRGYSFEKCYRSYRLALYDLILPTLVEVATLVDFSKDRVRQLAAALFERTGEAVLDHPLAGLIGSGERA